MRDEEPLSDMTFYKFDGAGNDFILVDIRQDDPHLTTEQIARLCHRRFGIGADGLMTLGEGDGYDFVMRYYNSDGREATMCGNGGRCITAFAAMLGIVPRQAGDGQKCYTFLGPDGPHTATVLMWDEAARIGLVRLGMRDVPCDGVRRVLDGWLLDTGSPHYVQRVEDLDRYDVAGEGRRLRNRTDLWPEGVNVNFIEDRPDGSLAVRTYERGVEDETWACGTGVTACAIVTGNSRLHTRGGDFKVTFTPTGKAYTNVQLTGPVACNFTGAVDLTV